MPLKYSGVNSADGMPAYSCKTVVAIESFFLNHWSHPSLFQPVAAWVDLRSATEKILDLKLSID